MKPAKEEIIEKIQKLYQELPGNILPDQKEVDPLCRNLRMFDAPVPGFADAHDPIFEKFKTPGIVGPWYLTPSEWLPSAGTVISLFFPISEEVRRSNGEAAGGASVQWMYTRYEGQQYIDRFMEAFSAWLSASGSDSLVPSSSQRFGTIKAGQGPLLAPGETMPADTFSSNWSERHAAYACGLGTFSLTRAVITEKGAAGRFASVITEAKLPADKRNYSGVYDYCVRCGACIERCPVSAIDLLHGKDQLKCAGFNRQSLLEHSPRYGCGLCQTNVPCEGCIPFA